MSQKSLDDLISEIGFGRFHYRLLALCGLGWWSDNMWFMAVAAILPRVQIQFGITDSLAGIFASSFFLGMALGSFMWGAIADRFGRLPVFNVTLVWTASVGAAVAWLPTFWSLCVGMGLLGFGVGGNMPVDGALFIEFVPKEKQYLMSALSVFFSFGSAYTATLAWILLPRFSCPPLDEAATSPACDLVWGNAGWRYLVSAIAATNIVMFLMRILWIRVEESPRFLLGKGRREDAANVLRHMARDNGHPGMADDIHADLLVLAPSKDKFDETTIVEETEEDVLWNKKVSPQAESKGMAPTPRTRSWRILFSRALRRTTILVWLIWIVESFAFNAFSQLLPKILESRNIDAATARFQLAGHGRRLAISEVYQDFFVYSIAGIPGPLIATWLAETSLGRRWTMTLSSLITAGFVIGFAFVHHSVGILMMSSAISFFVSLTYTTIFTYTPEVFETRVRGTATGIASGLGRIAGIAAPAIASVWFAINVHIPLFVSGGLFVVVGLLMALLPIETRGRVVV